MFRLLTVIFLILLAQVLIGQDSDAPPSEYSFIELKVRTTTSLTVDPNSIEMIFSPIKGRLSFDNHIENGFQYVPEVQNFNDDSFAFVADHSYYKIPVLVFGEIRDDGALTISYQILDDGEKFKEKDGSGSDDNPIDNGDGTVSFPFPPGMQIDITGTIVCKPSFPDGTIIFGLPGVNSGVIAGDAGEDSEIHHHVIESWDDVRRVLGQYPSDSIPDIAFVGHGDTGGVYDDAGTPEVSDDTNLNGHTIPDSVVSIINDRLSEDARIYVIACEQAEVNENGIGLQELANKTGRSVVANEDYIWVRYWRWGSVNWGAYGKWIEIAPKPPQE